MHTQSVKSELYCRHDLHTRRLHVRHSAPRLIIQPSGVMQRAQVRRIGDTLAHNDNSDATALTRGVVSHAVLFATRAP
jgi:hypothetical protein